MAQVSDWVRQGAVPGVDFDHFYGGMHEWFVAQGLHLSDGRIKALDYALVLECAVLSLGLCVVAWRRLGYPTIACLILLCTALLCTRAPLEEAAILTSPMSAHSFAYNRLGTALTILCAAVLLNPSKDLSAELVGGIFSGTAALAAILAKTTFFPVALGLFSGLILMRRWPALLASLIAFSAFGILADPSGARTLGTLRYSMESSGTGATESWLIIKAVRLILSQQFAVLAILLVLSLMLFAPARRMPMSRVLGALLILGAFGAASVAMGPAGLVGQQALPVIAAVAVLILPSIENDHARYGATLLGGLLVITFVLPHSVNAVGTTLLSWQHAHHVAIKDGPLSGYLARGNWRTDDKKRPISIQTSPDIAISQTALRLSEGRHDATTDYILLVDAVALLQNIPDIETMGIVSDTRLGISFAVGSKRVEGFPAWLRMHSPELAPDQTPLRNVDLVLLQATAPTNFTKPLQFLMKDQFYTCAQTPLWTLHVRSSDAKVVCPTRPQP